LPLLLLLLLLPDAHKAPLLPPGESTDTAPPVRPSVNWR
jgi:hypothetical protein